MTIQAALVHAADLSSWIDRSVHGLDISSGDRERMAGALFDQVHEHHKAIQLLLKNSLVGSAFSLVRSLRSCHSIAGVPPCFVVISFRSPFALSTNHHSW